MVADDKRCKTEKCPQSVMRIHYCYITEVAFCHLALLFLSSVARAQNSAEDEENNSKRELSRRKSVPTTAHSTDSGVKRKIIENNFTTSESGKFDHNYTTVSPTEENVLMLDKTTTENSTFDFDGNATSDIVHKLRNVDTTSSNYVTTNSTSFSRNASPSFGVPVGYVIGMSGAGLAILAVIVIIAVCWRRHRAVLLPEHSIYTVQETAGWDNISLHYIDNPADFAKDNSWDDLSDDSYLASLDEVIAQRASVVAFSKRNSAQTNSKRGEKNQNSAANGNLANGAEKTHEESTSESS